MGSTTKVRLISLIACLALLALIVTPALAQNLPDSPIAQPASPPGLPTDHEQIHRMIDEMFGPGTSQQLHETLGPDADALINQLLAMQSEMATMQSAMGRGAVAVSPAEQQMMQEMMAMCQDMPQMMLRMLGMMGSGMMPVEAVREEQRAIERMMQHMRAMMEHMKAVMAQQTPGGATRAPVQLPGR